ncbi:Pentatricopeptide repeat [Phaffia rhodozyma]|uniref:Pentatricopeptide repeat n=1 Tax=Phaffia rhodozyma TaxID=264483 RepID=A0A0F7SUW8_PHARH|nr:Pentatricopeptide repeat [Phaffia rhodozyma]
MLILSAPAVARLPPTFLAPCLSRATGQRSFHRSSSSEEYLSFRETEQSYDEILPNVEGFGQDLNTLTGESGLRSDCAEQVEDASSSVLASGAFKVHPSYFEPTRPQKASVSSDGSLLSHSPSTRLKSSHLVFMHPGWTSSPAFPNLVSSTASSTDPSAPWSITSLALRKAAKQCNQRLVREASSGPPSRGTEFPAKPRHTATNQREYRTTNPTSNWTPFSVVPPPTSSTLPPPPPLPEPSPKISPDVLPKRTAQSSALPSSLPTLGEPSGFGLISADITNIVEVWPKESEEPIMDYRKVPLSVQRTHFSRSARSTPLSPAFSYDSDSIQPFTLPKVRTGGEDSSSTFMSERVPPPHFFTSDPSALTSKTSDNVDMSSSYKSKLPFVNEAEAESLDPDDLWGRYLECEPAEVPPKMLSLLFKSQASHADPSTRQFRLLKIFLHAAQSYPVVTTRKGQRKVQWWLSTEQLRQTFLAGIEIGEAYRVDLGILDKEERKENAGKREAAAVILREAWRLMVELSDPSSVQPFDNQQYLWRWVGLVAGYGSPDLGASRQTLIFNQPEDKVDRIEALSLFLDKVGSWSPESLHNFAVSLSAGSSSNSQELKQEIELAETSVLDARQTQDELLVQQDSFYSRNIRRRLWKFIVGAYKGLNGDGEKLANGWVEDLLVCEKKQSSSAGQVVESLMEDDEEEAWMSNEQASSLLSRTTSAIILTRDILNGSGDISSEGVSVIIDSILRLEKSAPSEFCLPVENLRMLLVPLLSVYPQLETISPLHHHELLLLFLRHQDLPFTRRLYEMFRLRERAFVFEENTLIEILKLALGIRETDVPVKITDDSNHSNRCHPMARFAANIYDDHIAWGGTPLQGHILSIFLEVVGREPRLAGMATRALADSSQKWGDAIVTDDIVMAIAKSSRGRVIRSIQRIVQPEDITVVKRGHVSASDALNILPLIRGFYPSGQLPPVQAYNLLLTFIAQHPTKENVSRAVAEFTVMMNHGPKPDTETFNILLRMHLGVRQGPSWLIELFDTFEPLEPEIAMVRATTLFHTMIIRESLQPDESTFAYFMEALCQLGKPMAALESFQHAIKLNLVPNRSSTLKLSDSLARGGEISQARIVLDRWQSLVQDDEEIIQAAIEEVDAETMTSTATELSKTMLSTMLNTQAIAEDHKESKVEMESNRVRDLSEDNWKRALGFGLGSE